MQIVLTRILMTLGAVLLAILTAFALSPFLPPNIIRYVAVAMAFGIFTYVEEAYVKKSGNAIQRTAITVVFTVVILYLIERFR